MSGKDTFKHPKGSYERLNASNYPTWSNSTRRLLRALRAWLIVAGEELAPAIPAAGSGVSAIAKATKSLEDFEQRREDAALVIYNSCGAALRSYIDKIDDPKIMWDTLDKQLNTAKSAVGRQAIFRQFMELKPVPGEGIGDWFTKLLELKNQVEGTPEAITAVMFKTHVFTSLPDTFEVTSKIQQNNPDATLEEVIEALKEDEKIRNMRMKPEVTQSPDAFFAARGRGTYGVPGGRGRGRGLTPRMGSTWCSFCRSGTHSTEACRSKRQFENKRSRDSLELECFYCGEAGHVQRDCSVKHKGEQANARATKRVRVDVSLGEKEADAGQ